MSNKEQLSNQRTNTTINDTSKYQEADCKKVMNKVVEDLEKEYKVKLIRSSNLYLKDIVAKLIKDFPEQEFNYHSDKSNMRPDGGLVYLVDKDNNKYPILITEVKNQGTNDKRMAEGKKKQAMGNAVERLAKNVIGLRTYMKNEGIFPFVCFGYGCDFKDGSTILDRVSTISLFGNLNQIYLYDQGGFKRGSYFFREKEWSFKEMYDVFYKVAKDSIEYYFEKYGINSYK